MGLFDIFRAGKVVAHVVQAAREQRNVAHEMRAWPMRELVDRSLAAMHAEHMPWKASARPPRADAAALAAAKRLPADLAEFYAVCDGFDATEDFPAPVLPLGELRLGADHVPPPSRRIEVFWGAHGNDSDRAGWLAVLPPENLTALMTNDAESYVRPASLDAAVPIVPVEDGAFAVVLLTRLGERLPAGSVLEYENGSATRYDDFRHWLATQASLFASLARRG